MTNDMQSMFGIVDDGSTDKTIQKVQQFDKAIGQTESSIANVSRSLFDMDRIAEKSLKSANKAASGGGIGGAARGASRVAGAAGAFGNKDAAKAAQDIAKVGQAVSELGDIAKTAKKKTIALIAQRTALATAETAEGTAAGGAAVGTTALITSLGPLVLLGAAAAGGILLVSNALSDMGDEAKIQAATIENTAEAIATNDRELAATQADQLEREKEINDFKLEQLREQEEAAKKTEDAWDDFLGIFGDKSSEVFDKAADELEDANEQIESDLGALNDHFGELDASAEQAAKETEKAAEALQQLAEQESNLRAKRTQALDDLEVDRGRRDSQAAADAAEADAKRFGQRAESARKDIANTAKIRTEGAAQQAKTLKAANDEIIKTIQDGNQARTKLRQEFSDRAIEDQNRFNERRAQAENDFRNAEFDAIQENDIIGALRAQRAFDEQQKQDQVAATKETRQREDEKRQRLQQLRDEQSQRIAEVRANLVIEIAEQKLALKQRLTDQALAAADRRRQEVKADRETEKSRAKSRRRQAENDALADERSERAFKEQLKAIDDKRQAEQQALGAVFQTLQASGATTVDVIGQATAVVIKSTGQVVQQFVNGLSNAAKGSGVTAFAEGGIVTRPTLALIGENYKREAVIPLDSNGGIPGSGGQPIIINLTTSDIATVEEVIQIARNAAIQVGRVNNQVLADSLAGVVQ